MKFVTGRSYTRAALAQLIIGGSNPESNRLISVR